MFNLDDKLAHAFRFDIDDLIANRRGTLSNRQQRQLRIIYRLLLGIWTLIWGTGAIVVAALLGALGEPPTLLLGGAAVVAFALTGGQQFIHHRVIARPSGNVLTTEGKAILEEMPQSEGQTRYAVRISGVRFRIDKVAFKAFEFGRPYRIYYIILPLANRIISVEPIAEA